MRERLAGMANTGSLVLLRHGESDWNALNLFTGWVDVGLTDKGQAEAVRSGELIAEHDLLPDVLYTSLLRRAITTAHLALDSADRLWIPVRRSWRLNERHYGALQGLDKAETKARYGEEQFMAWRRSYDTPPPPIERGSQFSQDADPRYADIGGGPLTECLADVVARFLPYFTDVIVGDLRVGKTVLIVAHGNSLRALVKHLDQMSDDEIVGLNIPTGIPLRYDLDSAMRPPVHGRVLLDGTNLSDFDEDELRSAVSFFAEDAHIFATTVRDNLLTARGDCPDDELIEALDRVGLCGWLAGLPEGLSTVLIGGAQAVSAGQRRRLLLARAVLSPARIVLLDEPVEHLDAANADLLRDLLAPNSGIMSAMRTVVVATHHLPNDIQCAELSIATDQRCRRRGTNSSDNNTNASAKT